MPGRKISLSINQRYHVINRGVGSQMLFRDFSDYNYLLNLLDYYRCEKPPIRFSRFIKLSRINKAEILEHIHNKDIYLVEIEAFCLMPNHFHLSLRQKKEKGIQLFMSNVQNSFARYFNRKNRRKGPMFEGRFKAVRIVEEEQFFHVIRYIMLNPLSADVVRDFEELTKYPFSCLSEYLSSGKISGICDKDFVLSHFGHKDRLLSFVRDNADYQKRLQSLKRVVLEPLSTPEVK